MICRMLSTLIAKKNLKSEVVMFDTSLISGKEKGKRKVVPP
jgi:hypothetical protein